MKRPTLYHPHTGKVLEPLFVTKRGHVVYPILGASEDDGAPGPDDLTNPDDTEDEDDSDDSGDADDKESKSKKDEDDDDKPVIPQWKYDKVMDRMRAADKRASTFQKELEDLKKQGIDSKDVDAKLKEDNAKLAPAVEKLTKDNNDLRLQLAFVSASTVDWVDPSAALKLADLSDVDIDAESGKVDERALRAALKNLAKEKPYLVRSATKKDGDTDDSAASGGKMNGKRKGDKSTPDREALAKRFPALRG